MKDRKKAEANAEMRMQMIAPLLSPDLDHASMSALKQSLSEANGVSVRTLERYCKSYLDNGFEGLLPQGKNPESRAGIPKADNVAGCHDPCRVLRLHDEAVSR